MQKKLTLLIFLFTFLSYAQENTDRYKKSENTNTLLFGKISGSIKDATKKQVLPYANISLYLDSVIIDGTISNDKGYFVFNNLANGSYEIEISYTGYYDKIIKVDITNKKNNKNLKIISMESSVFVLGDIEVSDLAPVYENKIEKIVYNAENDLSQTANDGIDVIRNAPLVSVDIDGKISLRGSENVKFLLNGRSSSFLGKDNVSDVLQTISADQIKAIEVITSPTAKYDAEGDAGIINIITKKKAIDGFSGSLNNSTGTRVNRTSLNLNIGKGKFGLSARGGSRYGWPREGENYFSTTSRDSLNNEETQIRNGQYIGNWIGFNGSIDLYYDYNAYNSITSNFSLGGHNKTNEGLDNNTFTDALGEYIYSIADTTDNQDTEYEYTVNYIKKFPEKEEQELNIGIQYGWHIHDDNHSIEQVGVTNNSSDNRIDNTNDVNGNEITIQIDYTHPFGEDNKIELGVKNVQRKTNVDYETFIDNEVEGTLLTYDSLSNIFDYNQKVSAAYLSSSFSLPRKYDMLMGFRYENTIIEGDYNNFYEPLKPIKYNNIVPSIIVSKKLNMFQTIKLSYTNRIKRPDIHQTNTNIDINDLNNIQSGNPDLMPAQTHQLELGFNSFKRGLMTSFFLFYKAKNNIIESYTFLRDDNIFETNYVNAGDNHSLGFNFYGSTTIKEILNIRTSFDLYSYNMETTIQNNTLNRSSLNYNYMINVNLDLGKGYKLESRGFFRSPRQTIQGERPSFSMFSIGAKKEFNNKRGSIGIGMIEPLSKYKTFTTEIEGIDSNGNSFETISTSKILFRSVNIKLKYKFGKINFDPIKKKASIENNDLLEEEGDY
jgi:ferric enterobactin receptor